MEVNSHEYILEPGNSTPPNSDRITTYIITTITLVDPIGYVKYIVLNSLCSLNPDRQLGKIHTRT